ncbi:MAG TPA: LytR C-terminal domain-containing protein, partial [Actinomycetota bacterium]|nr:LytR C-terminal domain-containing protein [Actinomycetota bacterium]
VRPVPGKHAPESPASFYLSVARAVGGALVVLGVVAAIAIAATGGGGKKPTSQTSTPPPTISTHPTVSSTPSTTVTPTATATVSNLASITVDVLNGTQRAGLATTLANKLKADGYTVKKVGNQTAHQALTTIYYRVGSKGAADALLAAHPELKRVAEAPSSQTVTLTVVIGDDYKAA